jgi:hypothetical protein
LQIEEIEPVNRIKNSWWNISGDKKNLQGSWSAGVARTSQGFLLWACQELNLNPIHVKDVF